MRQRLCADAAQHGRQRVQQFRFTACANKHRAFDDGLAGLEPLQWRGLRQAEQAGPVGSAI